MIEKALIIATISAVIFFGNYKDIEASSSSYIINDKIDFIVKSFKEGIYYNDKMSDILTMNLKKIVSKNSKDVEVLDWWDEAQYKIPIDGVFEVEDFYTGKKFKVKRMGGTNHADIESLNIEDAKIMKDIWNGFSWERRPVLVNIDGKILAASMSNMPHAGRDDKPAMIWVKNRSDGYGDGTNYDTVKNNGMDGHVDLHFKNSTRHLDGKQDDKHQECIKIIEDNIGI
jgi:hypothetical protein